MIALSSTEAEYVALSEAGREATWLRNLYGELGFLDLRPNDDVRRYALIADGIEGCELIQQSHCCHFNYSWIYLRESEFTVPISEPCGFTSSL